MSDRPIHVVMMIDQFYPIVGGAEQQAQRISLKLIEAGHRVSVLTRQATPTLPREELYQGIQIHRLPAMGVSGPAKLKSTIPAAHWLLRHRDEYDLIHCHGVNPLEWGAMLAHYFTGKPYVLKLTNPNFLNYAGAVNGFRMRQVTEDLITSQFVRPMMLPVLRLVRKNMLHRAGRVLAISPEIRANLIKIGYKHVTSLPNGIDLEKFAPITVADKLQLRKRLRLSENAVIFVFSGRLTIEKNLLTLLKAWYETCTMVPDRALMLLLLGDAKGQNYAAEGELRSFAREKKVTTLSFQGSVTNVGDYLRAADVFVLPSFWEGMSNSLLEAMACGLPAIVSDIPANRALVEHNQSGLLFRPHNYHELAGRLQAMISDQEARLRMGIRARAIAENGFSLDRVVENLIKEYRALLSGQDVKVR